MVLGRRRPIQRGSMMFDVSAIDRMFDLGQEHGNAVIFALFDKRVLLPLEQLPHAVEAETAERTTPRDLERMATLGWFPLLTREGSDGERGAPLYAPSRIGQFLKLAREGYADAELAAFASYEETMIDEVFTTDDLAYIDDDLDAIIAHTAGVLEAKKHGERRHADGTLVDESDEIALAQKYLAFYQRLKGHGIPAQTAQKVARHAFRVRAQNDMIRVMLLKGDRDKVEARYSPWVLSSRSRCTRDDGYRAFEINWDWTLRSALAHMDGDPAPPIRVPGFLLRGDQITSLRTLRPRAYEDAWKELDLDEYLQVWATLKGERRCLACLAAIPNDAPERRRYCSERCRNAEKQRRHRVRNPEAVERAQKKYWESIELDDGDEDGPI